MHILIVPSETHLSASCLDIPNMNFIGITHLFQLDDRLRDTLEAIRSAIDTQYVQWLAVDPVSYIFKRCWAMIF